MRELLDTISAWQAAGLGIARAVVVSTYGSAPRRAGSSLLLSDDGRIAGSVSGGCVEAATTEEISRARETGLSRLVRYGVTDEQAWNVGLSCGGTIDVLVEPLVPVAAIEAARAVQGGRTGGRAVVTLLPDTPRDDRGDVPGEDRGAVPGDVPVASDRARGAPPKPPLVVHDDGRLEGSLGSTDADAQLVLAARDALGRGESRWLEIAGRPLFIEVYPVRPRLVIVGAEQVAMTLVRMARDLGYETVVVDGRAAFATAERFPDVDRLIVGWPDEVADEIELGPADAVAVLSHDVKFDVPAMVEALRRGCRYVGLIGSRRTQSDRRMLLRERGSSEEEIGRLRGPIGLDLGGRAPAETALAILAEVVAERYGGSGRPMREVRAAGGVPRAEGAPPAEGAPGRERRVGVR